MLPRDRAIAALTLRQPDVVPHFELEMQLTEEYLGRSLSTRQEWADASPSDRDRLLERDAQILIDTANMFDYCIVFYSRVHRPDREAYVDGIRVLRELDGGRHLLMAHGDTTMAIPNGEYMLEFVCRLADQREEVLQEEERKVEDALNRAPELLDAGLDGFALCSDYCFNSGPFMSPSMFADFVTPFLKKLVQGYRSMGAYVIKHTDGQIMPIIDQLIDAGPHGLHSLDPMAGVDIAEVKRRYGHQVCLIGNVNCALMQTGTDDEILESCRYAMENGKPGGGYIFSTSNVIFKGMPKRSYDLMMDFYRSHCAY
jgi:uroporphyrinogen decarboxylase